MPFLFLSPSTQTFNPYITTGNEQYWMNQLADRMVPYLHASGINVTRNNPNGSAAQSIRDSNAGTYDFHLALHSNASPEALAGQQQGVDIYYYPSSESGLRMANIIVDNLKPVYLDPNKVRAIATRTLGEVRRTNAPSVLGEFGYHDNVDDANWITESLEQIAAALALSVTEYFGVPFLAPTQVQNAVVTLNSGVLNLRNLPTTDSQILAQIPNGTSVRVWGTSNGWSSVEYDGLFGFARSDYLRIS